MKKMKLIQPVLVLLCAGLFVGYRAWDRLGTDSKPPEITIGTESIRLSVSAPHSALLQGITAQDDQDGDVTDTMVVEAIKALDSNGTMEVTVAAFDQSGNVSKATRTVHYTDYEPPRFSLSRPLLFAYNSNFDPLNYIEATDPLDGDLRYNIRAMSLDNSPVSTLGDHQIEFRVTNSLGDTTRLTLPVTVYNADLYSVNVSLHNSLIYLKTGSEFDAESYLSTISFGKDSYDFHSDLPSDFSVQISSDVNTQVPGVYPVDYTVTYTNKTSEGNEYQTGINRLIVVVEE